MKYTKKTKLLVLLVIVFTLTKTYAQIPNSGFENWTPEGNHLIPDGWQTARFQSDTTYYPVTRDASHYPASVGNYSIRLENKPSLLPSFNAYGLAITGQVFAANPAFAITGHPTSLTGYYKYAPLNGDTLWIVVILFKGGAIVSRGELISPVSAPNWASFSIPIPVYATADSGLIALASYLATGPGQVPHGNSVLNVDNLNFDNLITGISDVNETNPVFIYPNPSNGNFTLDSKINKGEIEIYNSIGKKIFSETISLSSKKEINLTNISSGTYFMKVYDGEKYYIKKLIVAKD